MNDCRRCFRTSRIYTPCTLLELLTWAEEMVAAIRAKKVLTKESPYFQKSISRWRKNNPTHAFNLRQTHLITIAQLICDPDAVGEIAEEQTANAEEFCHRILAECAAPFCCWPRILIDLEHATIEHGGFTLDGDRKLGYWQPDWPGFKRTKNRNLSDGRNLGCPNSMTSLTQPLLGLLKQDVEFQKRYWESHQREVKELLGGAELGPQLDISQLNYTVLMHTIEIPSEDIGALEDALIPLAAEMIDLFLAKVDQTGLN